MCSIYIYTTLKHNINYQYFSNLSVISEQFCIPLNHVAAAVCIRSSINVQKLKVADLL